MLGLSGDPFPLLSRWQHKEEKKASDKCCGTPPLSPTPKGWLLPVQLQMPAAKFSALPKNPLQPQGNHEAAVKGPVMMDMLFLRLAMIVSLGSSQQCSVLEFKLPQSVDLRCVATSSPSASTQLTEACISFQDSTSDCRMSRREGFL